MTDGDLISRKAVIDGINAYIEKAQYSGTIDDFISFEELVVKSLPAVKPLKKEQTDGDLISRQAVLDLAKDLTFEGGCKHRCVDVTEIHCLPSAEKTEEWISVRKQKPEDYEEVIATVRYDYKDKQEYEVVTGVRYSKEDGWEWAYEAGADYYVSLEEEVIAWKPLPNPYKEK